MLTLNKLLQNISEENEGHFAGPHYEDSDKMVFVVYTWFKWLEEKDNFNRVYDLCEQAGIDFRFQDEIIEDEQGRAHEINPGYHGQVATWAWCSSGDGIWTQDEVEENLEGYAESLENCSHIADKWGIDFTPLGYEKHSGQYESGFHPGQNDDPGTIQDELLKTYDSVIWSIDNTGQFDIGFSAWVKKES